MSRKSKAGVLGAITALAGLPAAAMAEAPAVTPAQSFADLLQPIPNAVERLKLSNAQEAKLVRVRMQDADHHHHAQTTKKGAADHHHHAQTAGAHHHHAQTAKKGSGAEHHHHAQTNKPAGN